LAKDHVEHIRIHKKAIDELALCKKEMWLTELDPECKPSTKIMATKERHVLTKTSVLLNGYLSFVTSLSKFHDKDTPGSRFNKPPPNKKF
jgi:hypothetical protein